MLRQNTQSNSFAIRLRHYMLYIYNIYAIFMGRDKLLLQLVKINLIPLEITKERCETWKDGFRK